MRVRQVRRMAAIAVALVATVTGVGTASSSTAATHAAPGAAAPGAARQATAPAGLSIGTWDVNLTPFLGGQDAIVDQVAGSDFDVLALQGVWSPAGEAAILADPTVQAKYPYHYSPPSSETSYTGGVSVSRTDTENYVNCLLGRAADIRTVITPAQPIDPACFFLGLNVRFLSPPLYAALVATLQTVPNTLAGGYRAIDEVYARTGVTYGYDGRPGQLILSAHPIEDPQDTTFATDLVRRDNIVATIDGLKIVFANWPTNYLADEDAGLGPLEFGALQPDLAQDALDDDPDLIVGSFQTGPDYQPDGYQLLVDHGYAPKSDAETYCPTGAAGFSRCQTASFEPGNLVYSDVPPRATDNIFFGPGTRCQRPGTFATDQLSEHIGVSAACAPMPVITGLSPTSGPMTGGQTVVITGTGFTGATSVLFGGRAPAASYVVDSDTQITAVTPAHPKSGVQVRVRTVGLTDKGPDSHYRFTGMTQS